MVKDDRIRYLSPSSDLYASANYALRDLTLIAHLYIPDHTAVETDLLDDRWKSLMVRLLRPLVFLNLGLILAKDVCLSGPLG